MPTVPARGFEPKSPVGVSQELGTWSVVASLIVGAAFLGLWFWLLPRWLGFTVDLSGAHAFRLVALVPSALGFAVAMRCIWDFGRSGHGTPAPIAPPQSLVVTGFYRYVRNPMYVGFFIGWAGLWFAFGHASRPLLSAAAAALIGVHIFVVAYEEPTLRSKFGEDYSSYCANVPRWLPRTTAWKP